MTIDPVNVKEARGIRSYEVNEHSKRQVLVRLLPSFDLTRSNDEPRRTEEAHCRLSTTASIGSPHGIDDNNNNVASILHTQQQQQRRIDITCGNNSRTTSSPNAHSEMMDAAMGRPLLLLVLWTRTTLSINSTGFWRP
jgi:hypothetical protein